MKLKIAICDDDSNIRQDLKNILSRIEKENFLLFDIHLFSSGEELNNYIWTNATSFDIIFLDIELSSKMDGVEVGSIIRNSFKDNNVKIVYISNYESYAMDLFQIRPFHFIIKPILQGTIDKIILSILDIVNKQSGIFKYKIGKETYEIDTCKVLYFTQNARKIEIKTYHNHLQKNTFYGKLFDISDQLIKADFFLINNFCLVNYYAVKEFKYKTLKLVNEEILSIAQSFRNDVRDMQVKKIGDN